MKKNYSKLISGVLLTLGLSSAINLKGQITVTNNSPTQCYNGVNQVTCSVTNTVAGTTSYSWSYASYPCGSAPVLTSTSPTIVLSLPCVGNYSIGCTAYNGSTIVGLNFTLVHVNPSPTVIATSGGSVCAGGVYTITASGANSYTWNIGTIGSQIVVSPSVSTCYSVVGISNLGCTGMASSCVTISTIPVFIAPASQTVCRGSSANFTASGTAVNYTWSAGATTSTINVLPNFTTTYTVTGIDNNGCTGMNYATVVVDSTCANVWPGDANSDGVVNSSDVFEIGLSYSATGMARSPGGNAYTSQYATTWTGLGSTGKNKCHIDCNGDGTVNNGDTVAIYNNYSLTHSFKTSESSAVNPDISLVATPAIVNEGMWQKADIMLGSTSSPISQLYGVAFDINFDNTMIQTGSAYIVYTSSFLNASNQNVQFRKTDFTAGKIYAASVRVNGSNVSGNGKIGEFWFQVKTGLPANSVLNLSVSNSGKISNVGLNSTITNGTTILAIAKNITSVNENSLLYAVQLFPNPASNAITLQSTIKGSVVYSICDIVGRELLKGEFADSKALDLSNFSKGTYLVRLENGSDVVYKKLILEK